jgi:hypothetical protein
VTRQDGERERKEGWRRREEGMLEWTVDDEAGGRKIGLERRRREEGMPRAEGS